MSKQIDIKAIKKERYNIIYADLKAHASLDSKEAHRVANVINARCNTLFKEAIEQEREYIEFHKCDSVSDMEHTRILDKNAVMKRIETRIKAGGLTKDQELKYIAELNKLQDNYSKEIDTEYVVELIQYNCPACDGAQNTGKREPSVQWS